MYTYTWYQWLTFFYLYCFFGWVFESSYVSLKEHHLVNRGFLRIPMLPLYGTGAIMMLWVSIPVQDSLVLTWAAGVVGATVLEYVTGYAMERLFKVRYWDYSDQKWNIHGYICLSSSIAWGFLTIFMTHLIHKPIERAVFAMPVMWDILFVSVATVVFVYDAVICVREAFAFGQSLEALRKIRQDLDSLQVQSALLKMEAEERLAVAKEEFRERMEERREQVEDRIRSVAEDHKIAMPGINVPEDIKISLEDFRISLGNRKKVTLEELKARSGGALDNLKDFRGIHLEDLRGKNEQQLSDLLRESQEKMHALLSRRHRFSKHLKRSNPTAMSRLYDREFKQLQEYIESGNGQTSE